MKLIHIGCTLAATLLIASSPAHAQGIQPLRLVTAPTAGTLPSRSWMTETHVFDDGGFAQRVSLGIAGLMDVGLSYSGANIIGSRKMVWQPHAGFQVRVRIIEETASTPAIAIGFDSQGDGEYIKALNRFRQKSKGAYLVLSRNYRLWGNLGFHGGANYSLEDEDDRDPSFWGGIDKDFGKYAALACEYDFATNDNEDDSMTANRGYLNAALKLSLSESFILEFDVRNILRNEKRDITGSFDTRPEPAREIKFTYVGRF